MAQRQQEQSVAALGERADKGSEGVEDEGVAEISGMARSGKAVRV